MNVLQPPWLEFGRLRLGQKKSLQLEVQNITDEDQVRIEALLLPFSVQRTANSF